VGICGPDVSNSFVSLFKLTPISSKSPIFIHLKIGYKGEENMGKFKEQLLDWLLIYLIAMFDIVLTITAICMGLVLLGYRI